MRFGSFVIIGVIIGAIIMLWISESLGMPLAYRFTRSSKKHFSAFEK